VPDLSCTVYGNGCTWDHNDFIVVSTSTTIISICGTLSYNVDVGIYNPYITYDPTLHIIIFYCEDMSLVGQSFTYTINVTIDINIDIDCSVCVACCGSSTGTVIVTSPCTNVDIELGIVTNIDFFYLGAVTWTPPPMVLTPAYCQGSLIFYCDYLSGPYSGPYDLCDWMTYQMCPPGQYWSDVACMCLAEIQCAMMCQPGQQLDPRYGCDCIPQTQYNAIMANCDTPYCDEGSNWSEDACICIAEIQCAMMCSPG
jgi:hypothetical protein